MFIYSAYGTLSQNRSASKSTVAVIDGIGWKFKLSIGKFLTSRWQLSYSARRMSLFKKAIFDLWSSQCVNLALRSTLDGSVLNLGQALRTAEIPLEKFRYSNSIQWSAFTALGQQKEWVIRKRFKWTVWVGWSLKGEPRLGHFRQILARIVRISLWRSSSA